MNKRFLLQLFTLCVVSFAIVSCQKDGEETIFNTSTASITSPSAGGKQTLTIKTSGEWKITSVPQWAEFSATSGKGNATVEIDFDINITPEQRTQPIKVVSGDVSKTVKLTQSEYDGKTRMKLPIIFHFMYYDESEPAAKVDAARVKEIIDQCNAIYSGQHGGVDTGVEFVAATVDPDGKTLLEAGMERIKWGHVSVNARNFMNIPDETNKSYIWDPERYVNIMVYRFSESNFFGVSTLPYTLPGVTLGGITGIKETISYDDFKMPYCSSVNSEYIFTKSTTEAYDRRDFGTTVAHEMGHFFGLFHVFENVTADYDFCDDTPYYDREAYQKKYYEYKAKFEAENPGVEYFRPEDIDYLSQRSFNGQTYESVNIMDYFVSRANRFTEQQRKRMQSVWYYSPMMVHSYNKASKAATRTAPHDVQNIEVKTMM